MATVGEIIDAAAASLGWEQKRLLRELAKFVKPSGSGDSDPKRETILGYERSPNTRCGHRFAAMMLDFLDCTSGPVKSETQRNLARDACRSILGLNQPARYHQPPRTNPASIHRVEECAGCYLLIRPATTDESLRLELLILSTDGRRDPDTYVTYLSQELVCRGRWSIVRDTVSCIMNGYRGHYARPDIVNLHLVYEQPPTSDEPALLRGFGVGLTRQSALPAIVPVIAIQMLDHRMSKELPIMQIGNGGDESPRKFLAKIASCKLDNIEKFGDVLERTLEQRRGVIHPLIGDIRGRLELSVGRLSMIVPARVVDLCKSYQVPPGQHLEPPANIDRQPA